MPIKFAVKIIRLKVHTTIAGPITLTFIQGHKCVSNLTTFNLNYIQQYFQLFTFKLGMAVDLCMALCSSLSFWWPWTWPWLWKRLWGLLNLFVCCCCDPARRMRERAIATGCVCVRVSVRVSVRVVCLCDLFNLNGVTTPQKCRITFLQLLVYMYIGIRANVFSSCLIANSP